MNVRIVAILLVGTTGLGFAVGYGWPRDPDPEAKQVLSLTEKIAADVADIQLTLASESAQRLSESGAAMTQPKRNDASNNEEPGTVSKNGTEEYVTAQLRQQADAIVLNGISSGRWTESDVRELRATTNGLSGAQKQAVVAPLLQAINAQQVRLEVEQGGVL